MYIKKKHNIAEEKIQIQMFSILVIRFFVIIIISAIKFKWVPKSQGNFFPASNILKYYKILYCLPKSFDGALSILRVPSQA